jgi:hypothetical protein
MSALNLQNFAHHTNETLIIYYFYFHRKKIIAEGKVLSQKMQKKVEVIKPH